MARPADHRRLITLGWQVVDWIETYLVHGPGDVQGTPLELDDEQVAYILQCYRLDEFGRRLFNEALFSRPKGRAKTEIVAAIGCAELLGPVRFDGFDAQGAPVGKPVTYPFIRVMATEESQASDTSYRNITYMLTHGEAVNSYPVDIGNDWQTSTRVFIPGGGEIRPSTGSNASKDGGKESHAIFEEPHLFVTPELRGMYTTVRQNTMKRKAAEPWVNAASTMYGEGENSTAEQLHRAFAIGTPRLLLDHREAPETPDLDDRESVMAGLTHAYGDFAPNMDLDALADYCMDPRNKADKVIRYFFNRATKPESAYFKGNAWERSALPRPVRRGERITVGFDGSDSGDDTWLRAFSLDDRYLFTPTFADGQPMRWKQPEQREQRRPSKKDFTRDPLRQRGWKVPRPEVHAAFHRIFDFFTVVRVYLDPPYWQTELKEWQGIWGDEVIVPWETYRTRQMANALERFDTDVRAGEVLHDGDPEIALQLGWAKGEKRSGGTVIAQPIDGGDRKIDGVTSTVLAYEAGMDVLALDEDTEDDTTGDFSFY